ncbi:thiol reductant ABC exporter subunit CydC [Intrasporangium calvum]|uniref:ABC transporter, CydDC cysteine exporter (CydDC-E) family, permease/ATP-binding protein CydC n=1 Tax=Intrasporangium calvum (strain ATCC 23552 / DSM 43043 / JCM 3097 / NBRC 12989 / NCIMB 10167 / NRRL B-3866 / 7 KIP) TaxID=710696 RepID=E6S635_INTC7|nr:thiol reductant ABC exporter subunit CydC [Intrasporangium calvum]ADU46775.1 ABC transporter, CydDC cysteine exporter (CydDC-E) family, permease/ATP-binding protein CydC [Intrasporangium calvum DSM 43043]AXG15138.1 thiol reductant ABC exporter subunit CydC [Intrasporangium calvum]
MTGPVRPGSAPEHRGRIALAGLLGGIATASGVALTATSGWLIARAAERPLILTLMTAIVAVRTFGIARPVFRYWERLVSHDASLATLAARRSAAYEALLPLTPARLGRRRRADVLTAVVHDITDEVEAQVRVTVPVVSSAVAGALAIGFTTVIAPPVGLVVALVCVAVALVSVLAHRTEARTLGALVAARAEVVRVSELVTTQADQLRAIGAWGTATRWLDEAHDDVARATRTAVRGRALAAGTFLLVVATATIATAAVATGLELSNPVKALLVLTPVALADAIAPLADAMRARAQAGAAAARTDALLTQDPAVHDAGRAGPDGADTGPEPFGGLRLEAVTASWGGSGGSAVPGDEQADGPVLGPFDLDLSPGETVAVVGPNGSGKSTLLAVLARHLDPRAGRYETAADGRLRDVLTEPLDRARARVAVVDDEPHVFATSVRNNLTLARPGATDEDVLRALDRAGLGRLVPSLPDGLDTVLGAGGRGLSGGERARLAIARAHLSRRPVIVLDEPVAHLDPPTARSVLTDLLAQRRDTGDGGHPAVVLVTHRPEGLHLVDRVFTVTHPHR